MPERVALWILKSIICHNKGLTQVRAFSTDSNSKYHIASNDFGISTQTSYPTGLRNVSQCISWQIRPHSATVVPRDRLSQRTLFNCFDYSIACLDALGSGCRTSISNRICYVLLQYQVALSRQARKGYVTDRADDWAGRDEPRRLWLPCQQGRVH